MTKRIDNSHVFTLKVRVSGGGLVIIRAFESHKASLRNSTHTTLDLELRFKGKDIFPKGAVYIGIPVQHPIDGKYAKGCAVRAFALKPGDTDADFFADYTPDQIAFVTHFGEHLDVEASNRFGEV